MFQRVVKHEKKQGRRLEYIDMGKGEKRPDGGRTYNLVHVTLCLNRIFALICSAFGAATCTTTGTIRLRFLLSDRPVLWEQALCSKPFDSLACGVIPRSLLIRIRLVSPTERLSRTLGKLNLARK